MENVLNDINDIELSDEILAGSCPFQLFTTWYERAKISEPSDPNAMTLATVGTNVLPSLRVVLMKDHGEAGFLFHSNCESRKGLDLQANPFAAINFYWKSLRRQVNISGPVVQVASSAVDDYFASRPRDSQIGAWASMQSRPLASRQELIRQVTMREGQFLGKRIPRPAYWQGWRLAAQRMEFWQERPYRLHDRFCFTKDLTNDKWILTRLFP